MKYRKCEICGLKTERKDGQKRYFMAKFPLDEARCLLWVKVPGMEDLAYVPIEKLHDNKFICGKHFTDKDFKKKRTQLKNYAVPSVRLTAPPLPDDILRDFPLHVYRTPSVSDEVCNSGTEGEEEMYRYIALNEWHNKKSLTYPTVKLCSMVEGMVKVFEEEARPLLHQSDIGNICRLSMLRAIDSSWICATHWSEITDQLLMQISLLLIRNDCKEINRTCSEKEESCADYNKKAQVMGIRRLIYLATTHITERSR